MRKYPYTDSTEMVIYESREKKAKKPKTWLAVISAALASSIFTAAVFGTGMYYMYQSTKPTVTQQASAPQTVVSTDSSDVQQLTKVNGKQVLTIPQIASQVGPSVVGVINKTKVQPQQYYDWFSGRFYYYEDPSKDSNELIEQGSGSGIIISDDGYVVTNQHVIEGATEVSVILNTGDEIVAKVIGQDTKTDLAVLKIDTDKQLQPATLGDSTQTQVGELAVAIGNPMGQEFSGSVTAGIVSAINRTMSIDNRTYNLLQTDAAINAGNSGGALINQYGEVIGINSVKLSSSGVEGMGFAIAISEAKPIIDELIASGYVTGRPLVGIGISETRYGLFIGSIQEGSGAQEAGLKEGDMILEVDGQKVSSSSEVNEIRDKKKPGDYLTFKIMRDGNTQEINVRLTESSDKN